MGTSLYDLTIPVCIRSLTNLSAILAKGEAWAAEKGVDPADLLATRLAEDMHPLPYQVQRACDSAKGTAVRIDSHVPTPLIQSVVAGVMQAYMQMQGGGAGAPDGL